MENKIDCYKIFESVARNQSISRASEELFISQPAVSQSIKKLEQSVGGELFNRTKSGVKLTSEGEAFYKYVKTGLEFIENGEKVFSSLKNIEIGSIRIGASSTITRHILMPYLKKFHKLYPNIDIEIVNHLSSTLVTMLKSGLLDLIVLNLPMADSSDLDVYPFIQVQDIFCASSEYIDVNKTYTLKDLKNYKLITQKRPSNTRSYLDGFIKSKNIELIPSIEAVGFSVVVDLTKIGFGYSYVTKELVLDEINNGSLCELKLTDVPTKRDIGLAIYKNTHISFASQKLIDIILSDN